MAQRFVNNFLKKHLSNVTDYDRMFTRQVLNDIGKFVYNEDYLENELTLLTFPPLNSHYRYIIHRLATILGLKTICIGEGRHRIIMIGQHECIPTLEKADEQITRRVGNGAIKKINSQLTQHAEIQYSESDSKPNKIMSDLNAEKHFGTSNDDISRLPSTTETRWFKNGELSFQEFKPFNS